MWLHRILLNGRDETVSVWHFIVKQTLYSRTTNPFKASPIGFNTNPSNPRLNQFAQTSYFCQSQHWYDANDPQRQTSPVSRPIRELSLLPSSTPPTSGLGGGWCEEISYFLVLKLTQKSRQINQTTKISDTFLKWQPGTFIATCETITHQDTDALTTFIN